MNLSLWATGFLAYALYLALQQFFGATALLSACLTGLFLLLVALLTGNRISSR